MTQKTTLSPVTEHELLGPCVPALPIDQEQRYLLGSLEEAALEAVEDIDGTFVVVLQRGSHHHVVVGILIEVLYCGDGGPESGILVTVRILQCSIRNEPILEDQGQAKAQGDLARAPESRSPLICSIFPASPLWPHQPSDRGGSYLPWPGSAQQVSPGLSSDPVYRVEPRVPLGGCQPPRSSTCLRL